MSLTLVNGEWRPHDTGNAASAPSYSVQGQPNSLRPLQPSRLDDYSWRVRAVLSHRLLLALRVCLLSAALPAFLWLFVTQADDLILSFILFAFRSGCWGAAVATGVLPLLILRGRKRSTQRIEASTKLRRYLNLYLTGSARDAVFAYWSSSILLSLCLAWGLGVSTPIKFALPSTTAHGTWQFSEAFLLHSFVMSAQAISSALSHALSQRNLVVFATEPAPIASRFVSGLAANLPSSALRTAALAVISIVLFGAFSLVRRSVLIFLLRYLPGVAAVRGNLYALFKGGGVGVRDWAFLLFELAFVTLFWEIVNALADVYFSQPILVSGSANNPTKALFDGLSNRDSLIQHFAYNELSALAQTDAPRRIAIFRDVRSTPNGFARISKECLQLLDKSRQLAAGRGVIHATSSQPGATARPSSEGSQQPAMERALVQRETSIFRPTRKSFLDTLSQSERASSMAVTKQTAAQGQASASSQPTQAAQSHSNPAQGRPAASTSTAQPLAAADQNALVPAILRSKQPSPSAPVASTSQSAPETPSAPYNPLLALETHLASRFPHALGPVPAYKVSQCLPNPQLNIWACEALSYLAVASLAEDEFGVVQQELPKILEALVDLAAALEPLMAELNKQGPASQDAVVLKIAPVTSAVQSALARIVEVFGPYLGEFRFAPRVAARLKEQKNWSVTRRE